MSDGCNEIEDSDCDTVASGTITVCDATKDCQYPERDHHTWHSWSNHANTFVMKFYKLSRSEDESLAQIRDYR